MKKLSLVLLILTIVIALYAADPVAYLVKTKGSVQLYREQKAQKFKNGELLFNNDEIITNSQSYAAVKYMDGSATLKVFPNSVLRVNATKQGKLLDKNVAVQLGSVYSKVSNKIKGAYKVESPNTVASVKGTGFIFRYNADKKTIVIVLEGEVLVQNKASGKSMTVTRGQTAVSDDDGNIEIHDTTPEEISDDEQSEIDTTSQENLKTIRIQVADEQGNLKYIEITY
jgi:hypothetical protein